MSKEELNKQAAEKAKEAEDKLKKEKEAADNSTEETKQNIQDTLD
ncbi:glycopeptide resistance-associated protein GraF [Staphylococcus edaphicus]|uniref:Glycopeptide resistance-associated protein GraF n=1 Tax=Staphylococcus edaphicus TaxID=1955013 RepID=A0ABY4QBI5_9STAP|nr:glycopeptide resistance-associated protein GraF [Staphylococcus edaphicus]UQW80759.1 glycopeptide resistance-associated protein GraF [Staphylococcus edaphicus]